MMMWVYTLNILKGPCHEIFDLYFFINQTHLVP